MTSPISSAPLTSSRKDKPLAGEQIAILIANGFNEDEMTQAQRALLETGARIKIVSLENGLAHGWHDGSWGHYFAVDEQLSSALAADYSMLLIPGGQRSLDKLKQTAHTARFVKGFMSVGKPVAVYGDAVQMLAHVGLAEGRAVTGDAGQQAALTAAGASWSSEGVAIDGNLLTGQVSSDSLSGLIAATVAHFVNIPSDLRMAA